MTRAGHEALTLRCSAVATLMNHRKARQMQLTLPLLMQAQRWTLKTSRLSAT